MLPFRKILCPTDFSDPSFEALDCAKELALTFGAELILAHAIPQLPTLASAHMGTHLGAPFSKFNLDEYVRQLEAEARETLDSLVRERVPLEVRSRDKRSDFSMEMVPTRTGCPRPCSSLISSTMALNFWLSVR